MSSPHTYVIEDNKIIRYTAKTGKANGCIDLTDTEEVYQYIVSLDQMLWETRQAFTDRRNILEDKLDRIATIAAGE